MKTCEDAGCILMYKVFDFSENHDVSFLHISAARMLHIGSDIHELYGESNRFTSVPNPLVQHCNSLD